MSSISAGTTTTTGYVVTSDTTGALVLKTGASGTTAVTIGSDQSVTFAGSQTFSGGTANGVLYLNGSKVATSGSALTFDGSGNFTLGGTTPRLLSNMSGALSTRFIVQNSTTNGNTRVYLYPNGTGTISAINGVNNSDVAAADYQAFDLAIIGTSDVRLSSSATGAATPLPITFYTNGSEQMRLNSTGLGIGTSSPAAYAKLTVAGTAGAQTGASQQIVVNAPTTTAGQGAGIRLTAASGAKEAVAILGVVNQASGNAGAMTFHVYNGGADVPEYMRLDSSGNLGLGVTPSAWASGTYKAFQIFGGGAVSGSSGQVNFSQNFVGESGGEKYIATAAASSYSQVAGSHRWYNAPSGTAGNAITFTQAMTLDASGNFMLGTTTIGAGNRMKVVGNNVVFTPNTAGYDTHTFSTGAADVGTYSIKNVTTTNVFLNSGGDSYFNGGSVGIGTSSPGQKLDVSSGDAVTRIAITNTANAANGSGLQLLVKNGATTVSNVTIRADNADNIQFFNIGGERARIDASGVLLVNRTSYIAGVGSACKLQVLGQQGEWSLGVTNGGSTQPYGILMGYGAAPNTANWPFFLGADSATTRFSVYSNGGIANYSANDVNLSDRREKKNFAPAKSYLDVICSIPVQTFNYIDQNMEDDDGLTLGVVAQDVQAVAPELVMESNWANKDEEPKIRLSVYQTDLQYALMKCIQEQQAIIESLTQRIAALEGQ